MTEQVLSPSFNGKLQTLVHLCWYSHCTRQLTTDNGRQDDEPGNCHMTMGSAKLAPIHQFSNSLDVYSHFQVLVVVLVMSFRSKDSTSKHLIIFFSVPGAPPARVSSHYTCRGITVELIFTVFPKSTSQVNS